MPLPPLFRLDASRRGHNGKRGRPMSLLHRGPKRLAERILRAVAFRLGRKALYRRRLIQGVLYESRA